MTQNHQECSIPDSHSLKKVGVFRYGDPVKTLRGRQLHLGAGVPSDTVVPECSVSGL